MEYTCKICGNKENNKFYTVREMQFGTRDNFIYCECNNCGCLQLVNPPDNLSKYYPSDYFSFKPFREKKVKEKLNVYRDRYAFGINNLPGRILHKKLGDPTYVGWLKNTNVTLKSPIMDVGCGSGKLLFRMGNLGFTNLLGIDNFIDADIYYKNGVKILKRNIFEIDGKFDLIMLHHSLEHMDDQHSVFGRLSNLISSGQFLLIRIPTCSSFAWGNYREDWFALEAPRHFFNHSLKSIKILYEQYGFELTRLQYDSRSIQLWGSEQYKKNIPLMDERSYFINPETTIFSKEQKEYFESETVKLNAGKEGDQLVLFLRKI